MTNPSKRTCNRTIVASWMVFIILVQTTDRSIADDGPCDVGYIKCAMSTKCIWMGWICDGDFDCGDNDKSDEERCQRMSRLLCVKLSFRCLFTNRENGHIALCKNGGPCDVGYIKCAMSTKCIRMAWICDGDFDCGDNDKSDEEGCPDRQCSFGYMKCAMSTKCIQMAWKCDGDLDCGDNDRSDEEGCPDRPCYVGDIKCAMSTKCIRMTSICDGDLDCGDNDRSDEEGCHGDDCRTKPCPDHSICEITPINDNISNASCVCDSGFEWTSPENVCKDINECDEGRHGCPETCVNTKGGYRCECLPGYALEKQFFCRAEGDMPWLLVSTVDDIRKVRVDSRYEYSVVNTTRSTALDFDYDENLLFYIDNDREAIKRVKITHNGTVDMDRSEQPAVIISNNDSIPFRVEGIAVDWLYKHIYWTDWGSTSIKVATYDGRYSKTLISAGLGHEPVAIALDPENGLMYWTAWGEEARIEQCGMDGNNRNTLKRLGQAWPTGLTIDYVDKRLYWINWNLLKISSTKMDGTDHRTVLPDALETGYSWSISVFEDSLYIHWTDGSRVDIGSVNKFTGNTPNIVSTTANRIRNIIVYHAKRQDRGFSDSANALCSQAGCAELCLPAARITPNATQTVVCSCSDENDVHADKKTCQQFVDVPTTPEPVASYGDDCGSKPCPDHSTCDITPINDTMLNASCVCDSGFEWTSPENVCKDINECDEGRHGCSQTCINTKGGYTCECLTGYVLEKQFFCRAEGDMPWLLLNTGDDIRKVRVDSRYEYSVVNTTSSRALDFDYDENLMFYIDNHGEAIKRMKITHNGTVDMDRSEQPAVIISNNDRSPLSVRSIAVDWLYKHIYWTERNPTRIKVATYDGRYSKTLISTGLDIPLAIALDPENGLMYWTDGGEDSRIERCGMDGNNRNTLKRLGSASPIGLTIDYVDKRLYWIDYDLHMISSTKMDGTDHRIVLASAIEIEYPLSISVFEDSLYWNDLNRDDIRSVNKFTGNTTNIVSTTANRIWKIVVYHAKRQDRGFSDSANALCSQAGCAELCLPAARITPNATQTVVCSCSDENDVHADKTTCQQFVDVPTTPEPVASYTDGQTTPPNIVLNSDTKSEKSNEFPVYVVPSSVGGGIVVLVVVVIVVCLIKKSKSRSVTDPDPANHVENAESIEMDTNGIYANVEPQIRENDYEAVNYVTSAITRPQPRLKSNYYLTVISGGHGIQVQDTANGDGVAWRPSVECTSYAEGHANQSPEYEALQHHQFLPDDDYKTLEEVKAE